MSSRRLLVLGSLLIVVGAILGVRQYQEDQRGFHPPAVPPSPGYLAEKLDRRPVRYEFGQAPLTVHPDRRPDALPVLVRGLPRFDLAAAEAVLSKLGVPPKELKWSEVERAPEMTTGKWKSWEFQYHGFPQTWVFQKLDVDDDGTQPEPDINHSVTVVRAYLKAHGLWDDGFRFDNRVTKTNADRRTRMSRRLLHTFNCYRDGLRTPETVVVGTTPRDEVIRIAFYRSEWTASPETYPLMSLDEARFHLSEGRYSITTVGCVCHVEGYLADNPQGQTISIDHAELYYQLLPAERNPDQKVMLPSYSFHDTARSDSPGLSVYAMRDMMNQVTEALGTAQSGP